MRLGLHYASEASLCHLGILHSRDSLGQHGAGLNYPYGVPQQAEGPHAFSTGWTRGQEMFFLIHFVITHVQRADWCLAEETIIYEKTTLKL